MQGRPLLLLGSVVGLTLLSATAAADETRFGRFDIPTLFAIGKNENRNEVQYGIRLDRECVPVGSEPVFAYWRDYEEGPSVTSSLGMLDRTVYGIKSQSVAKRTAQESKVLLTLKSTPGRTIAVVTHPSHASADGKCVADTYAYINGTPALLDKVFVHVAGFMSVDWIEIKGTWQGKRVVERVKR